MQNADLKTLERLAVLFTYPSPDFSDVIRDAAFWAEENKQPDVLLFANALKDLSVGEMEEQYIETFDMNPAATLDIGWHLFGEDYARGELLVKLRSENRRYGVDERGELPDNLAVVLNLLSRLPGEDAEAFSREYLLPSLRKIREGVKRKDNPYLNLLTALLLCLGADPNEAPAPVYPELTVLKEMHHG